MTIFVTSCYKSLCDFTKKLKKSNSCLINILKKLHNSLYKVVTNNKTNVHKSNSQKHRKKVILTDFLIK
jgi:hypothetical protein